MLLFLKLLDLRGCVVLIDTALSAESVNICQLVDSKGMLLIERDAIKALASRDSFGGGGVFNKGESNSSQYKAG
jgi:hypothetical protein